MKRRPSKPRAWRVTDRKPPPTWQKLVVPGLMAGGAVIIGLALLLATGVFGATVATPTPAPTVRPTREIVSSTIRGNTPTPTDTPLPSTQVPAISAPGFSAPPSLSLSPAPPVQVQQVTPAAPPRATPTVQGALPGAVVTARPSTAATSVPTTSIQDELRGINATATVLSARVAALSSSSPAPSGTPRPAPTDTPIPTAAPPIVPQPSA